MTGFPHSAGRSGSATPAAFELRPTAPASRWSVSDCGLPHGAPYPPALLTRRAGATGRAHRHRPALSAARHRAAERHLRVTTSARPIRTPTPAGHLPCPAWAPRGAPVSTDAPAPSAGTDPPECRYPARRGKRGRRVVSGHPLFQGGTGLKVSSSSARKTRTFGTRTRLGV